MTRNVPGKVRDMMRNAGVAKVKASPKKIIREAVIASLEKEHSNHSHHTGRRSSRNSNHSTTAGAQEREVAVDVDSMSNWMRKWVSNYRLALLKATENNKETLQNARLLMQKVNESMHVSTTRAEHAIASLYDSLHKNLDAKPKDSASQKEDGEGVSTEATATLASTKKQYYHKVQEALQKSGFNSNYVSAIPFDERWDHIQRCLSTLGRVSTDNKVKPMADSAEAFQDMWVAVDEAKKEVLWQTYICKDDTVGQKTIKKLVEASKRGCTTELLYDCGGNISGRSRLTNELKTCGATVIPYRPFFKSFFRYLFRGFDWKRSPGLRNHRKILLVDENKIGFCGGLNIGNEYCGTSAGGSGKFRDTHVSVVGPAVAHLREVYDDTKSPQLWKYGWTRWRQIASTSLSQTYEEGVEDRFIKPLQTRRERVQNKSRVYIRRHLQRAEDKTEEMIDKVHKSKTREQLRSALQWYKSEISPLHVDETADEASSHHPGRHAHHVHGAAAQHPADAATAHGAAADATVSKGTTEMSDAALKLGEEHYARILSELVDPVVAPDPAKEEKPTTTSQNEASSSSTAAFPDDTVAKATTEETNVAASDAKPAAATSAPYRPIRISATKRKVLEARLRSMKELSGVPHKRAYTQILMQLPLGDEDPVPEAALYGQLRPETTQILSCNPRYRDYSIQYAFWQVTRKCHRRLWVTTPYYLPNRKLFRAMIHAAERGVDVRLLAGSNSTTDPWFMWHASNYVTARLLRAGVKVYEYKGSQIMHAKTVVVDSIWSSVGSYNWDVMSNRNLEVCLCHLGTTVAREMERQFLDDMRQSEEVKEEVHCQRGLWLRFTSWIFYHAVYVLDQITFHAFGNEDLEDFPGK